MAASRFQPAELLKKIRETGQGQPQMQSSYAQPSSYSSTPSSYSSSGMQSAFPSSMPNPSFVSSSSSSSAPIPSSSAISSSFPSRVVPVQPYEASFPRTFGATGQSILGDASIPHSYDPSSSSSSTAFPAAGLSMSDVSSQIQFPQAAFSSGFSSSAPGIGEPPAPSEFALDEFNAYIDRCMMSPSITEARNAVQFLRRKIYDLLGEIRCIKIERKELYRKANVLQDRERELVRLHEERVQSDAALRDLRRFNLELEQRASLLLEQRNELMSKLNAEHEARQAEASRAAEMNAMAEKQLQQLQAECKSLRTDRDDHRKMLEEERNIHREVMLQVEEEMRRQAAERRLQGSSSSGAAVNGNNANGGNNNAGDGGGAVNGMSLKDLASSNLGGDGEKGSSLAGVKDLRVSLGALTGSSKITTSRIDLGELSNPKPSARGSGASSASGSMSTRGRPGSSSSSSLAASTGPVSSRSSRTVVPSASASNRSNSAGPSRSTSVKRGAIISSSSSSSSSAAAASSQRPGSRPASKAREPAQTVSELQGSPVRASLIRSAGSSRPILKIDLADLN